MTATAALRRLCSGVGAAPLEAALGSLPDTFTQLPVCDSAPEGSVPFFQGTPLCHCPAVAESPESLGGSGELTGGQSAPLGSSDPLCAESR